MRFTNYFEIQKLCFASIGIHIEINDLKPQKNLIKHPSLLFGIFLSSFFHLILIMHYACVHVTDFVEITDSIPLLCQLLLCLLKVVVFLSKRQQIFLLIRQIYKINIKAQHEELLIVQRINAKDNFLCILYFRLVLATGSCGIIHPILYGIYIYFTSGLIVLNEANKASYFWNHNHLTGYSAVYILNICSIYFCCFVSLAFDTLFAWFVSNIVAQFHIICYRFEKLAKSGKDRRQFETFIVSCVQYHRQALNLAQNLNHVYGEIIFIKIIISCSEICSLVFRMSRPNDSLGDVAYKMLFLCAVALQLILYCWNSQRIKDESINVSSAIYCAFDWSRIRKSHKKSLLISMMRSRRYSYVRGIFFEVDLSLYLWIFKTAGSLITALRTLEENQA